MDNYIEIWDLDQTSNIEPTLILGRAPVLSVTGKKRKNKKKVITHHDSPVTCLAWNKHDNFRWENVEALGERKVITKIMLLLL